MTQSSRRNFLKTSVGAAAVVTSTQSFAQSTPLSKKTIAEVQSYEAKLDIETTANWNDGLAHPIPYKNPPGKGKERGIALGGGGTPLLGFYAGYFNALRKNGVDLRNICLSARDISSGEFYRCLDLLFDLRLCRTVV